MKILLILLDYPSCIATVIRWSNIIKYLDDKGYEITILTAPHLPPDYPKLNLSYSPRVKIIDTNLGYFNKNISAYCQKHQSGRNTKKSEFTNPIYSVAKFFYRTFIYPFFIPDPAIEWLPTALKVSRPFVKACNVIITVSGWPISPQIVGYRLKKQYHKPWIADMNDPWAFSPINFTPFWRRPFDKMFERKILREMDKLILTTEATRTMYMREYPELKPETTEVITCGFDAELLKNIQPETASGFRIVYTGSFYDDIRNPLNFFKAVQLLKDRPINVLLAGFLSPKHQEIIKSLGIAGRVRCLGSIPYEQVLSLQKEATLLLLIGNLGRLQIPSKVFEYLGIKKPILVVKNEAEDLAADIVLKTNSGVAVSNDPDEIAQTISRLYSLWESGKLQESFSFSGVNQFSWESLALQMERVIIEAAKP